MSRSVVPSVGAQRRGTQLEPGLTSCGVEVKTGNVIALRCGGKLLAQYPATIGDCARSAADRKIGPSPSVLHYPWSNYDPERFWNPDPKKAKTTAMRAGSNALLGVVWIGLSKAHYGIHVDAGPGASGFW